MSHRITYESKIVDRDLAVVALKSLNMAYQDINETLRITSGPLNGSVINLSTGKIESDSDWNHSNHINSLKIAYTEADARRDYNRTGVSITGRQVVNYQGVEGVVILHCHRAVG
jgi:hypothetical protein